MYKYALFLDAAEGRTIPMIIIKSEDIYSPRNYLEIEGVDYQITTRIFPADTTEPTKLLLRPVTGELVGS